MTDRTIKVVIPVIIAAGVIAILLAVDRNMAVLRPILAVTAVAGILAFLLQKGLEKFPRATHAAFATLVVAIFVIDDVSSHVTAG